MAYEPPIYVSRCIFVDGVHLYAGVHCPHERTHDQEGEILPAGWTAQKQGA